MTKPVSRQRRWQIARRAAGLCSLCGAKASLWACGRCRERHNAARRKKP